MTSPTRTPFSGNPFQTDVFPLLWSDYMLNFSPSLRLFSHPSPVKPSLPSRVPCRYSFTRSPNRWAGSGFRSVWSEGGWEEIP